MWQALIGPVFGIFKEFVDDWRAGRAQKRAVSEAVTQNKIRLAQSEQTHNQAWEMAALEGRDTFLRRLSFLLLTFPLVWAGIDPAGAKSYFADALSVLPDWYVWMYSGVVGAIWGLAELRQYRAVQGANNG